TDKAATVNEVPKNHLTVVNRFFDEAKLSVTFPEKSTFSTESAKSSRSQQTAIGHKLPAPDGSTYYDKLAKNCCHGFARLYATVFMKILFVHGPNSSNQNIRQAPPLSL
ncbi:hypothetical protein, partial [Pseudomonas aeruginosa]|uniref:hypothetical protein n=1 Tax=Pseudomonas aeruginosa TaxID=287 RepID=UPI001F200211